MNRFLADECFSGYILTALKAAGLDVTSSRDSLPAGDDLSVLRLAFQQGRILLTEDKDFGDLTVRFRLPSNGVVRVNLKSLERSRRADCVLNALTTLGDKLPNALVTIDPARTRVRPFPKVSNP